MKDFGIRGYRISEASTEIKLIYTGFLVFAFIGYLTFLLIAVLRVGPGYAAIVTHYRGSEMEEAFPRAFGQILEEAHFHAFIEGVVLLILTHLFIATRVRPGIKIGVMVAAFGGTLADLACPWLVRYVAPGFAGLQMVSWALIGVSAAVLIGVPLREMWSVRLESE